MVTIAMMWSPHFPASQCIPMDPDIDADADTDTWYVHTLGLMGQNHCLLNTYMSELDIIAVKFNGDT